MTKFVRHEQCPRCAERGADRRGNNLGVWSDGGAHCFSCGYHRSASFRLKHLIQEEKNDYEKTVLPSDYAKEVPSTAWRWLLQYGLPYSYWQAYCGYSEKEGRLIFPVGTPTQFSIGRSFTVGASKWKIYGDKSSYVEVLSKQLSEKAILVEDLISAHKVAQVATCIPLFGTSIHDNVMRVLKDLNRPVTLWLDDDQYSLLPKKVNRLQSLLGLSAGYIHTAKDPKEYNIAEITERLV